MWLRKLVGIMMIITLVGMNALMVVGILVPPKKIPKVEIPEVVEPPTVTMTVDPGSIAVGSTSGLSWTSTGKPTDCEASGDWTGKKTQEGAESTGRKNKAGKYDFTITCRNASGEAVAKAELEVTNSPTSSNPTVVKSPTKAASGPTYCGGRLPCYGASQVSSHKSGGSCWGFNGDRVINISGFDAAYHQAKSGIGSIEVSGVCGADLGPSINGSLAAGGQTRNHNPTTKNNSDKNVIPYFVGYYDGSKP